MSLGCKIEFAFVWVNDDFNLQDYLDSETAVMLSRVKWRNLSAARNIFQNHPIILASLGMVNLPSQSWTFFYSVKHTSSSEFDCCSHIQHIPLHYDNQQGQVRAVMHMQSAWIECNTQMSLTPSAIGWRYLDTVFLTLWNEDTNRG